MMDFFIGFYGNGVGVAHQHGSADVEIWFLTAFLERSRTAREVDAFEIPADKTAADHESARSYQRLN